MKFLLRAVYSLTLLLGLMAGAMAELRAATPDIAIEVESYRPNHPFWVALTLTPGEGQQISWRNPGGDGIAPVFNWSLPEGFELTRTRWAVPEIRGADDSSPIATYEYSGPAVLLFEIVPPRDVSGRSPDRFSLSIASGDLEAESQLLFTLAPGDGARVEANRDRFAAARAMIPLPSLWPSMAVVGADAFQATVYVDRATLDRTAEFDFLPGYRSLADPERPIRIEITEKGLEISGHRVRGAPYLEFILGVLLLSDENGTVSGAYGIQAWNDIKPLRDPLLSAADDGRDLNMALALLFALLGGVILNLMPCVFPVLSIKLFALVRSGAESPRRMRLDAIAYTAGILVSFLIVAGALLLFRGLGQEVGWGFQLQSPGFVLSLIMLLSLVGLNLLGMFHISAGALGGLGARFAGREGTSGAFFTGVLATVVATPCTAPFMAPALGFALAQPTFMALGIFLALGMGLALPYLLVGWLPALHRHFPRTGPWMERLQKWLALPMFATVLWLIWVLQSQTAEAGIVVALVGIAGLIVLILASKMFSAARGGPRLLGLATAVLMIGIYSFWATGSLEYSENWGEREAAISERLYEEVPFSRARLAELRRLGKPVFLNFTATWCITCIVTDRLVLDTREFGEFMRDNEIVMMKADWTQPDDEIARMLESFGRSGIPFYVFYPANPQKPAVPLPQILTVDGVIGKIGKHLQQ